MTSMRLHRTVQSLSTAIAGMSRSPILPLSAWPASRRQRKIRATVCSTATTLVNRTGFCARPPSIWSPLASTRPKRSLILLSSARSPGLQPWALRPSGRSSVSVTGRGQALGTKSPVLLRSRTASQSPSTRLSSPTLATDSSTLLVESAGVNAFGGPDTRVSPTEALEVTQRQCTLRSPTGRTRPGPCASTLQTGNWPEHHSQWAGWLRSTRSETGRTALLSICSKNSSQKVRTRESSGLNTPLFSSDRISTASPGSG